MAEMAAACEHLFLLTATHTGRSAEAQTLLDSILAPPRAGVARLSLAGDFLLDPATRQMAIAPATPPRWEFGA